MYEQRLACGEIVAGTVWCGGRTPASRLHQAAWYQASNRCLPGWQVLLSDMVAMRYGPQLCDQATLPFAAGRQCCDVHLDLF